MSDLRYTLLADGPSDRALLPILSWLLGKVVSVEFAIQPGWADLRRLPARPQTLTDRIISAVDLFPCDLLFVHRDAEREPAAVRVLEIQNALEAANERGFGLPAICVVPVRMTEAWLLFDEAAIRRAAGNPNSRHPLSLPPLARLEFLPDPKSDLHDLLRQASGLRGRRLRRFEVRADAPQVSHYINDFSPLSRLLAFSDLEIELRRVVEQEGGMHRSVSP